MPARSGTIVEQQPGGLARFNWEGPYSPNDPSSMVTTGSSHRVDVTGHGDDCEPFEVHRLTTSGGRLNRSYGGTSTDNWFADYLCQWFRQTSNGQHLAVSGVPSEAWRCTNAVNRTNPSQPISDVPVNALEAASGVQRLHDAGTKLRRSIRAAGSSYLSYQFSIRPLVADTIKMLVAQDVLRQRILQVERLVGKKGLRRTVSHGKWSSQVHNPSVLVQSTYDTINVRMLTRTIVEARTHVRWVWDRGSGIRPTPEEIRMRLIRALRGGTLDFHSLWELLPWTWLIDWFGNVGDVLKTNRNIIPARLVGVYPMLHTKTITTWPPKAETIRGRLTTISGGTRIREDKLRSIGAVALSAQTELFSAGHLGILAALGASRS